MPGWLISGFHVPAMFVCYVAVFHCPFSIVYRVITWPPLWVTVVIVEMFTVVFAVSHGGIHRAFVSPTSLHGSFVALVLISFNMPYFLPTKYL